MLTETSMLQLRATDDDGRVSRRKGVLAAADGGDCGLATNRLQTNLSKVSRKVNIKN